MPEYCVEELKRKSKYCLVTFNSKDYKIDRSIKEKYGIKKKKKIDSVLFRKILEESDNSLCIEYFINIFKRKDVCSFDVLTKIKNKYLYANRTYVLNHLKNKKIINDAAFAADIVQYMNDNLYGKEAILKKLNQKHLSYEIIKTFKFDIDKEIDKGNDYAKRIAYRYENESFKYFEIHMQKALQIRGYGDYEIEKILKYYSKNKDNELKKLTSEIVLLKEKYSKVYKVEELNDKIKKILLNKGFDIDDIIEAI